MTEIIADGVLIPGDNVRVHTTENIYFENGGIFPNTRAYIRVMTTDGVNVRRGDEFIYDGMRFTVVGVKDNRRRTTLPHWKITARG